MGLNSGFTRAERYTRVTDWKAYRENFDKIFRKKPAEKGKKSEKPDEKPAKKKGGK